MGAQKYQKEIEELFKKSPVVNFNSINLIIKNKNKKTKQYVKLLIRNLILKGKIKRLTKGFYSSYDDPSLIVFCFDSAYLGLQDALSFHNLWEQEIIPVIITTQKIRQGIRSVSGTNVLIRRINKKYFFGFEHYKYENFYLPYSDVEKTFLDMVYFKEKISQDVMEIIKGSIDRKKLYSYLRHYPKKIKKRVLNILEI